MFVPVSNNDKCERSTAYLDITDPKRRIPTNRIRARRYSVSFDGRTTIVEPETNVVIQKNENKPNTVFSPLFNRTSSIKFHDNSYDDSIVQTIPESSYTIGSRNLMTSSLIENNPNDKGSPVNRELAVQLLKEYVKSLKDFSSLLKLRQNQETKDSSTSPIHSPPVYTEKLINDLLPNTNQSVLHPKQLNFLHSNSYHDKPFTAVSNSTNDFSALLNNKCVAHFSSQSTTPESFGFINNNRQNNRASNVENTMNNNQNSDGWRQTTYDEFGIKSQTEVPEKVILRKFFQQANEPQIHNNSSDYSEISSTEPSNYSSDFNMELISPAAIERSRSGKPMTNSTLGKMRSEAAFQRQYTQLLWPADMPNDSTQQNKNTNTQTAVLELKHTPYVGQRRASSDANFMQPAEPNNSGRLISPANSTDPFASSKLQNNATSFQTEPFRRGGSVSPSIRLNSFSSRSNPSQQAFGKYLNTSNTARVLLSPPLFGSSTGSDGRRPIRTFASTFEHQLIGSEQTTQPSHNVKSVVASGNSYVFHHKVVPEKPWATSVYSASLKSNSELPNSDELLRETPPPQLPSPHSPSIPTTVSGSQRTSFECFNSKGMTSSSSLGTRIHASRLSPNIQHNYSGTSDVHSNTTPPMQHYAVRRHLSDFGPTNRSNQIKSNQNLRDSNRGFSENKASLIHSCTNNDGSHSGQELPKSLSSYATRRITAPIVSLGQNSVPTSSQTTWTTVTRTDEVKRPLGIRVDETRELKTDGHQLPVNSSMVDKLDMATQTESFASSHWPLSSNGMDSTIHRHSSNESLQSNFVPSGPVLQMWPLSLQSVVKSSDLDNEVNETNSHNGENWKENNLSSITIDDSLNEQQSQASGSPTPVPSPNYTTPPNRSAFSRPLVRRHSLRGAMPDRPSALNLGNQTNTQNYRLSLSRPVRSSLGSPTYNSVAAEQPRCRSVHFSTDVLVAHTGHGPEPLMLSSAPLKEPASCDEDDSTEEVGLSKPFSKSFATNPKRLSLNVRPSADGKSYNNKQNISEFQISNNPRPVRPTPFRRNIVPRGSSEPNF